MEDEKPNHPMHRLRTLIVDENPEFLDAAAKTVRSDPNCDLCGVASSSAEAFDLVWRQAPDLVLLGVRLGEVSGFLVAAALRAALPECRVLMMSLRDVPAYRSRSSEIGAAGFLAKHELLSRLPAIVAELAASRA